MPIHPVTNNGLLEGANYRTWALAIQRLLDAEDLPDNITTDSLSDRRQHVPT